jgi:flagellum-specific ATP synthase
MASYKESEDLINVGAYARGTNIKVDKAISVYDDLMELLRQRVDESYSIDDIFDKLVEIARKAEEQVNPDYFEDE